MLHAGAADSSPADVSADLADAARDLAIGPTVARLCRAVREGDVLFIASSEQRGEAVAKAASALADAQVIWLPPADALPGETMSAAIAGRRVAALSALAARGDDPILLVTDASAAVLTVAPPKAFADPPLALAESDAIDGAALAARLEGLGYFADERVDEPGEFAIRGGAVDLFPADADQPVRIHLEDGRIGSIDRFDAVTQIGEGEPLDHIELRAIVEPEPRAGNDLFAHLPKAALAIDGEAAERRGRHAELVREAGGKDRLVADQAWRAALSARARIDLKPAGEQPGPRFVEGKRPERALLAALKAAGERGDRLLLTGSPRDLRFFARRLEQRLGETPEPVARWSEIEAAAPGAVLSAPAELDRGWSEPGLTVFAAADMLGGRALDTNAANAVNPLAQDASDFHLGDAAIHEDHGLAILRGIEPVAAGEEESDAIRLEYAGEAQRLVPVEEAHRLWRYGADAEALTLDKLDGSTWAKRRGEIDLAIADTARQLVALAEERAGRTAPVLDPAVADYERFAGGFAFGETPDQARAIEAVRADLAAGKPMDRLVVGDVGYGKTEVALRAAALAALAGKQVALLAPTTVLVRQHLQTFAKRFARLGIEVAGLSRLSTAAEARKVKQGLQDGSIRIVVGTKMLAGKGVEFADLGLVVIDEEQRFGTADKAKLRGLAADVHVLTLTATPIPRTLQTALVGLQQLSLIATPPARRLPTRSQVASFAPELVRPALLREQRRGGQSFVVVPRIEDMAPMAERLARLVPDLVLLQAHGKMAPAEIDEAMLRFANGDGDILLATNIIEAGLDIPRANTMLIWRADRFGLAQLHQLRGRVGRGRVRGHLLLLTEPDATISPATLKRLRTLEALDQLGAGFAISARDLDLRGAGELLGDAQAGHMKLIGLGLYQHLLGQALRAARGEAVEDWTPELHLGLTGRLPDGWIPEPEVRINLYARIARLASGAELDALADELEDRFGTLPPEAVTLLGTARIRRLARPAGIARVDAGPAAIALTPRKGVKIDAKAAGLTAKGERLLLAERTAADGDRLRRITELLEGLTPD